MCLSKGNLEIEGVTNQQLVSPKTYVRRVSPPLTLPGVLGPTGWMTQRLRIEINMPGGENVNVMMPRDSLMYS